MRDVTTSNIDTGVASSSRSPSSKVAAALAWSRTAVSIIDLDSSIPRYDAAPRARTYDENAPSPHPRSRIRAPRTVPSSARNAGSSITVFGLASPEWRWDRYARWTSSS